MKRQRGQVLVIFVVALVSLLLMAGLLIDGGTAWAEMRHVQNAADAAARAGAIVLAERAVDGDNGGNPSDPTWGARVYNEVHLSAIRNNVAVEQAMYTDRHGDVLAGEPVDGGAVPPGAAGVEVLANRAFRTHLVRLAGYDEWRVGRAATAIAGPTAGCYDTLTGCELLPITFPVTILACGQGNTSVLDPDGNQWATGEEVTIPLCGGNPGSVGWIDWTPPSGGTDELEEVILDPPPQDIPLPSWKFITETGDISAAYVEDALNTYAGDVVLFPMFDSTCNTEPSNNQLDGCPPENTGGSGVNQWYHISHFLFFQLASPKGAFVNGDNSVACAAANAKECVKGAFVQLLGEGGVIECPPEGCPRGTSYTVQLIR